MINYKSKYKPETVKGVKYKYDVAESESMVELLRWLVEQQSPSNTKQSEDFIANLYNYFSLKDNLIVEIDRNDNIYITKGVLDNNEYYPCLVAHTDTNQEIYGDLKLCISGDLMFGMDVTTGLQAGIGADDKIGITIITTLLDKFDKIKLFIPNLEEVGYLGTAYAMENHLDWFNDIGYLIQPDRNGKKLDFIEESNGYQLFDDNFYNVCFPTLKRFGYSKNTGIGTDVGYMKGYLDVCTVNVSCGYQNEHSREEIAFISKMMLCLDLIETLVNKLGNKQYYFQSPKPDYKGLGSGLSGRWNGWADDFEKYEGYTYTTIDDKLTQTNYYLDELAELEELKDELSEDDFDYFKDQIIKSSKDAISYHCGVCDKNVSTDSKSFKNCKNCKL